MTQNRFELLPDGGLSYKGRLVTDLDLNEEYNQLLFIIENSLLLVNEKKVKKVSREEVIEILKWMLTFGTAKLIQEGS